MENVLCRASKTGFYQSLEEAIELADPNYYPNLHASFRVLLTMPDIFHFTISAINPIESGKSSSYLVCISSTCSADMF
jgi:hypothetical protein